MHKSISVRGAREHNLQDVSVDIPRDKLVVITGLSGSGKSSLAFDTIYAEGQRRYVESLSAYARQFLELQQKPEVDHIEGLSPAISIEQKTTSKNPRSTVATVTEIYDYMRLLWARVGIPYSPATGLPIQSQTVSQMVDRIMGLPEGTKLLIMAPVVRERKGEYRKELAEWMKKGYQRVKIDGEVYDIQETPKLDKNVKHTIAVVVDRIAVKEDIEQRLAESLEACLLLADDIAWAEDATTGDVHVFSAKFACPDSGFTIDEIEPRLFSFNNPAGACPTCDGLGTRLYFDPVLIVPDDLLSLSEGAIAPWHRAPSPYYGQVLKSLAKHLDIDLETPWKRLPKEAKDTILFGSGKTAVAMKFDDGMRAYEVNKPFEGVIPNLEKRWREAEKPWLKEELEKFQDVTACASCGGHRLRPEALAIKIASKHIGEVSNMSILEARNWFATLSDQLTDKEGEIARRILREINDRLGFLVNVGLEYLSLSRTAGTLSGGESQRIRLASQIGSGLTGVLYVLDEPSIGLHQRDNERLLDTLVNLRDMGNTVVVVEHDEDAIRIADYVIDMGPGAGVHGGHVVAEGTPPEVMANPNSITGQYLSGIKTIPIPEERRQPQRNRWLEMTKCSSNNLQDVDLKIPVGVMTCITGVSGSGKSTLTMETLYKALALKLNNSKVHPGEYDAIRGLEYFDKVVDIDQSPIGRTPRSNPATYTGAFTPIREWFAGLPEAKARGYKPGRFSFNVKGGRCEACQGDGLIKIEMHFLPDVYVTCDVCHGKRYNRETLEVEYKGSSISDVLDLTVEAGVEYFQAIPAIREKLETLHRVGLSYIKVGQPATTLSGGEAQRVKLAKELSKRATGRTLYILDEPTTGLHFEDVRKLMEVLQELVDAGNTIVIIEHNLEVIKQADWIVDMGPEGGHKGGRIVAQGTPEDVSEVAESFTGQYLKPLLAQGSKVA